mmetsp:Transcript_8600/g.13577  ORF Transcript_8600/g.13577 Transcript_8600/m.13577 type:complete len:146 (-) Transcript_8600:67-504(-)
MAKTTPEEPGETGSIGTAAQAAGEYQVEVGPLSTVSEALSKEVASLRTKVSELEAELKKKDEEWSEELAKASFSRSDPVKDSTLARKLVPDHSGAVWSRIFCFRHDDQAWTGFQQASTYMLDSESPAVDPPCQLSRSLPEQGVGP